MPLRFHPGTHWLYSWSTDVCARLVEVLSGQRFDDYLRATIFEPLGMVDTGFRVPDDQIDRFAACYSGTPTSGWCCSDDPLDSRVPAAAVLPVGRRRAGRRRRRTTCASA